ncbi:MAG: hypothetical protein RMM10_00945 [Anaerolineae bacterium]|uniref:hypothetical protein n=1 Tax=Thermoflexus sp. TaxID=1969742 RepID=UPI0025F686D2|nr:hypothetical protein [Thermoflexus sp.]MCS7350069.1 hypothetical protein [Thermoflexus sp.]MDW8179518.1 hypothetical protein [Anaerolineae bacterium]
MPRPGRPAEQPAKRLEVLLDPRKPPQRLLLIGHRASGKSTELTYLARLMERDYFVLRIPLNDLLDVEKTNPLEVLFMIGVVIHQAAEQAVGTIDRTPLEELKQTVERTVHAHTGNTQFQIDLDKLLRAVASWRMPPARPLPELVSLGFTLGLDLKLMRSPTVDRDLERATEALNALIRVVEGSVGRSLLLIVDDLDESRQADMIRLNFVDKPYLGRIACRAVYAAPIELYYDLSQQGGRRHFGEMVPLSNVRLFDRGDPERKDREGFRFMREVIHKRLERPDGPQGPSYTEKAVFARGVVNELIMASGGIVSDLIRLVRLAIVEAEMEGAGRIERKQALRAIARLRRLYEAAMTPGDRALLKEAHRTHQRPEGPRAEELIRHNYLLSYLNETIWFDAHPILWPLLEVSPSPSSAEER